MNIYQKKINKLAIKWLNEDKTLFSDIVKNPNFYRSRKNVRKRIKLWGLK